jgi:1-aminocyclopropane-1-carboxylate deaminase/D-cysteine desulfhydrase-like pyridoxal-dependent ACC family enzyme
MQAMAELSGKLRGEGLRVAEIPLGGSVPLGALGFVRATGEAKAQLEAMNIGPRAIFHSSSSGGTQAGIVAGCQLFDWRGLHDFGVSPDDPAASIGGEVTRILQGLEEILGVPLQQPVTVLDQFTGAGYGIPAAEGDEATELLARTEGIMLDPVYTAKAMAALIAHMRTGEFSPDDDILFWHTGGQLAHFYLPEAAVKEKR